MLVVFIYEGTGADIRACPQLPAHFRHMAVLEAAGQLKLGGAFTDGTGAVGILETATLEEAEALIYADPLVQSGVVRARVKAWEVSVPWSSGS